MTAEPQKEPTKGFKQHKIDDDSVFFNRIAPLLFIGLAVIMVVLVLFAVGVITGVIVWR